MKEAFILILAYPETVVEHADERYARIAYRFGIGNKTHIRAGHAALVLIKKTTGHLEYFDFGRYITPKGYGRVRGASTDSELNLTIKAKIEHDVIRNLEKLLKFFATHPHLTHGEGHLYASVCNKVDYDASKHFIEKLQNEGLIAYAAFKDRATNCARFVTDTLIASVTDKVIKSKLSKSKRFTPSTLDSVVWGSSDGMVYKVSEQGDISYFKSSLKAVNKIMFLDKLKGYKSSTVGKLLPQENSVKNAQAQWLEGIGAGAWFELYLTDRKYVYRFRKISPNGRIVCNGEYREVTRNFDFSKSYRFVHYSNCLFFHIEQHGERFRFVWLRHLF